MKTSHLSSVPQYTHAQDSESKPDTYAQTPARAPGGHVQTNAQLGGLTALTRPGAPLLPALRTGQVPKPEVEVDKLGVYQNIVTHEDDIDKLLELHSNNFSAAVRQRFGDDAVLSRKLAERYLHPEPCSCYEQPLVNRKLSELMAITPYLNFPRNKDLLWKIFSRMGELTIEDLEATTRVNLAAHADFATDAKVNSLLSMLRERGRSDLRIDFSLCVADAKTADPAMRCWAKNILENDVSGCGFKYDVDNFWWHVEDGEAADLLLALEKDDSKIEDIHMDGVVFSNESDRTRIFDASTRKNGALKSLRLPCDVATPDEFRKLLGSNLQELEISIQPESNEDFTQYCEALKSISSIKILRIPYFTYKIKIEEASEIEKRDMLKRFIECANTTQSLMCMDFTKSADWRLHKLLKRPTAGAKFAEIDYDKINPTIDGQGLMEFPRDLDLRS